MRIYIDAHVFGEDNVMESREGHFAAVDPDVRSYSGNPLGG